MADPRLGVRRALCTDAYRTLTRALVAVRMSKTERDLLLDVVGDALGVDVRRRDAEEAGALADAHLAWVAGEGPQVDDGGGFGDVDFETDSYDDDGAVGVVGMDVVGGAGAAPAGGGGAPVAPPAKKPKAAKKKTAKASKAAAAAAAGAAAGAGAAVVGVKRKRGRPKGSKNRKREPVAVEVALVGAAGGVGASSAVTGRSRSGRKLKKSKRLEEGEDIDRVIEELSKPDPIPDPDPVPAPAAPPQAPPPPMLGAPLTLSR